jgi:class 3 adenylate cyclase
MERGGEMNELSLVNDSLLRQRLTELDTIASWAPHILSGLERFIRTASDYDLFRVNPIQYATATGLSEAEGIELFVHAAKVGLFEMQWLLTCAYCPQVAGSFRELDQVHPRFQCEFCNALNDVALERESLAVSDITYLFTDLKDSTPLYESVGDVNAYFLVRQHFDILNKIIRQRSGTMVKTIGDAVMAGFDRPQDAVLASIEMIEELSRFNQTASRPLGLKVGVHRGRAIAVRLNDRIDYFGQDVNIAARVQGLAGVNEVCLTEAVMEAPGVSDIVKGRPASRDYENLKGIGQKMEIYRIEISPASAR